ncbi:MULTISPECIES: MurR/RpiR family transcriptional regulator [Rhizobium/Agrobacterium group]|uniref:MurR/RpiR family transcriptional regulator n=1 Tax=Rhizobium/Agrobacterium group TaxID=227290 RepID=UPI00107FB7B2|nr:MULTISPECIES: MurR/RpiR family transcriptional regulator [Rhizobium/Agrobacterium group]MBB4403859.1 DNA-binding MurR/RpiR family transcriptional regulator [Agrobacterium radiobacter]MBB5590011.1 DNA-binding MurR/RpiR family transcriptional regulator [Agrobacterium radiobacter]TGE87104.1 transcriptional regulator [Rhizobium sp. SEMIA 4032]
MRTRQTFKTPTSIQDMKGLIVTGSLRLSEQHDHVARTILARPHIVAFGTIGSLASECAVSPSTVVRVANSLGFDRFSQFRRVFRTHVLSEGKGRNIMDFL